QSVHLLSCLKPKPSIKHHKRCPHGVRLKLTQRTLRARHMRISGAQSQPVKLSPTMTADMTPIMPRAKCFNLWRLIGDMMGDLGLSTGAYMRINAKPTAMEIRDIRLR